MDTFLKTEKHPTVNDIYDMVRKENPKIGLATVYRTMELIYNAGLARKVGFGDGIKHYEHRYRHPHHHHLICVKCGKVIEIASSKIDAIQKQLAEKHAFTITRATMRLFGICNACKRKEKSGSQR